MADMDLDTKGLLLEMRDYLKRIADRLDASGPLTVERGEDGQIVIHFGPVKLDVVR